MENISENKLLSVISDNLSISNSHSIQPNILIRTPLFVPIARNSNKDVSTLTKHDVSSEFRGISLYQREGYEYASIKGEKLNVRTDFRVWCGVIFAFSKYGYNTDCITMKLSEFTKFCGFSTQMLNAAFRKRIQESLERIQSQTVSMSTRDGKKATATSLLKKFIYDTDRDEILLEGDPELWELYRIDRQILISMKTLSKIPRAETAQCLYLFLASLPNDPIPVTMSRIRERLSLNMSNKEANRSIKNAIKTLEKIGYLEGKETEWNGEWAYQITDRNRALTS
ncbi:TPA: replication protein RepA, partial [Vibrio parahaemolyticus]|nr:replication protein RepA [Vibrio parahaemolyticus]HCH5272793.1 replication protein RepA [Vibrio parahaemolyticus]